MSVMEQLWDAITRYFEQELTKTSYETWISELKPLQLTADTLYVEAGSELHKDYIGKNYLIPMRQVAYEFLHKDITVELVVAARGKRFQSTELPGSNEAPDLSHNRYHQHSTPLNKNYTFDNFIVGDGNKMAHAAALAVAENPGTSYNPLFFYGGVGLGKTHLMQAIGHEVLRTQPDKRVKYVSSETFTNDLVEAIGSGTTAAFHEEYRSVDVLLVDDIQFIGNKQATQEEFFHTFNALYNSGKLIVLTSDRDASQIPELEDRLVSRFKQGLSTDITPPDLETRIAILTNKARVNRVEIPDETLSYIAGQIDSNIRELEGALTSVQAYAATNHTEMTPDIAAKALRNYKNYNQSKAPSVQRIQAVVADYFDLTTDDLIGKGRKRQIVVPRQIAMYLARQLTDLSLPKIGQAFGGRDHTTVLHAVDKIESLKNSSKDTESDLTNLKNLL